MATVNINLDTQNRHLVFVKDMKIAIAFLRLGAKIKQEAVELVSLIMTSDLLSLWWSMTSEY